MVGIIEPQSSICQLFPEGGPNLTHLLGRQDYFPHLNEREFARKLSRGDIPLPVVRAEATQKAARGVHLIDLAAYLDKRREAAQRELRALTG